MRPIYLKNNLQGRTMTVLLIVLSALIIFAAVALVSTTYADSDGVGYTMYAGTEYTEYTEEETPAEYTEYTEDAGESGEETPAEPTETEGSEIGAGGYISGNGGGSEVESGADVGNNNEQETLGPVAGTVLSIHVGDDAAITMNLADTRYCAVLDGHYLYITLPSMTIAATDISVTLPEGWELDRISHGMTESNDAGEMETQRIGPQPYTLVRIRHTWLDSTGETRVGIMPLATSLSGWTNHEVNSHATLYRAITYSTTQQSDNRIIAITGSFNMTTAIAIPAGRRIKIVSRGTNVSNWTLAAGYPRHTIQRYSGGGTDWRTGRHFVIHNGPNRTLSSGTSAPPHRHPTTELTLAHVILCGDPNVPSLTSAVTFTRGGVIGDGTHTRFTMQNGAMIRRCRTTAETGGGGVQIRFGNFTMHAGAVLENNLASNSGGGLQMQGGTHVIHNGTFRHNSSRSGSGGGIQGVQNAAITIHNVTIHNNRAQLNGGGLALDGATATINNGTIRNNDAVARGGGIRNNNSTITMHNGVIYENRAADSGGVDITNGGLFDMRGGHIRTNATTINNTPIATGGGVGVHLAPVARSRFHMRGGVVGTTNNPIGTAGNAATRGGGVWVGTGGEFRMFASAADTAPRVDGNRSTLVATEGGGGVHVASGGFLIMDSGTGTITRNTAAGSGGGVNVMGGGSFTMAGGAVQNNTAARTGGGVDVLGTFTMTGGVIQTNNTTDGSNAAFGGGGVRVSGATGTFTMSGTTTATIIRYNISAVNGGGVLAASAGQFTMNNGRIHNNTSRGTQSGTGGGGVHARNANTRFTMNDGIIDDNRAPEGAGVYINAAQEFRMTGGHIRNNRYANTLGNLGNGDGTGIPLRAGGIRMVSTSLIMSGGTIGHINTAAQGNRAHTGGGVYANGTSVITMSGGRIACNAATSTGGYGGGAVRLSGAYANFTMNNANAIVNSNTAAGAGGGIEVMNGAGFTMTAGSIRANTAVQSGGGIFARSGSSVTLNGGTVYDNRTTGGTNQGWGGGGVAVTGADSGLTMSNVGTAIRDNTSAANGGGVLVAIGAQFTMNNGTITGNTANSATQGGGGVHVRGRVADGDRAHFLMQGGTIGGTTAALRNTAVNGGGVYVTEATFYIPAGTTAAIVGNRATGSGGNRGGGGVLVTGTNAANAGFFTMRSGDIRANTSTGTHTLDGGGGVLVQNSFGGFALYNGTIRENVAPHGGGVRIIGSGEAWQIFTMRNGTIENNRAVATGSGPMGVGGGVHVQGTQATMYNGIIRNNQAASGGGVRIWGTDGYSTFIMNGGSITGHTVSNDGGGVNVTNPEGTFLMQGGTIGGTTAALRNTASSGGGVDVNGGARFVQTAGTITGNNATNVGGGVRVVTEDSIFAMEGGTIGGAAAANANTAVHGGGVDVSDSAHFLQVAGTITGNNATMHGGGVRVTNNGNFTMNGGTIGGAAAANANTAVHGGGVWTDSTFIINGTDAKAITSNRANYGGGVYVALAGQMRMMLDSSNLGIRNNRAAFDGGGIFTEDYEYEANLTLTGGTAVYYQNLTLNTNVAFSGNTAGNGAYSPPNNANITTVPNIRWNSLSVHANSHPLNNFDINYRRTDPPPTGINLGGNGTWVLLTALMVLPLSAFIIVKVAVRKRRAGPLA
ncbi:MAG: hypothetical protein FWE06_08560 [Oscillospiraceae bacterium]|nr:hypothetical protein [Oscillospiraceae bacterium]